MSLEIFSRLVVNGLGEDVAAESWILRTSLKGKDGRGLSIFFFFLMLKIRG